MEKEINNQANNKKSTQKFAGLIFLLLLTLIVAIVCIFGIGIYGFNWQNSATRKSMDIFPYPISLVNFKFLRYSDFHKDVDTLVHYYNKMNEGSETASETPSVGELEIIALKRMIKNEFTHQLAKEYKINVSNLELEQELEKITSQSQSKEDVEGILKDLYNWNTEDLKENVLYYHLLRAKLQEKLSYDDTLEANKQAAKKADEVLALIKKGDKTFEDLAKEYSEDPTASQGGKLGFFGRGEMVSEFEEAAVNLKIDEVSEIVRTKYGFHIIKLTNKEGQGDNVQMETSHILLKTQDMDEYINDKLMEARVYVFAKGIKWDKKSVDGVVPGFEETGSGL